MRTIWKFERPLNSLNSKIRIPMPVGSEVLSAENQRENLCLWAIVDDKAPKKCRHFIVAETGHELPNGCGEFIGTVQFAGGSLVFHIFEAMWSK